MASWPRTSCGGTAVLALGQTLKADRKGHSPSDKEADRGTVTLSGGSNARTLWTLKNSPGYPSGRCAIYGARGGVGVEPSPHPRAINRAPTFYPWYFLKPHYLR